MNTDIARDDAALDAAIARLDVAGTALSPQQEARRDALLNRIVAETPEISGELAARRERFAAPGEGRRGRRRATRLARWAIPAAVAAGLAGVFALTGSPGSQSAYASWTPDPTPVTGSDLATAEGACRANLAESLRTQFDVPAEQRPTVDPATLRTVVAEQRGDFVFLSMVAADTSTSQCFFGAGDLTRVQGSTGGLATAGSPAPPAPAPGQIAAGGAGASSGPEGSYAFTAGRVAPGTRAVTVRTGGQTIHASVSDGHFAAWWPARAVEPNSVEPLIAYDVTLADGRVVRDARDVLGTQGSAPGPRQIGAIASGGGVGEDGPVATVSGRAGSEVASVTIHVGGRSVPAPVTDGTFTAQWPSGSPEASTQLRFDVHLRDGSVLTDQEPVGR